MYTVFSRCRTGSCWNTCAALVACAVAIGVAGACTGGAPTCDNAVDNVALCEDWVETMNDEQEECGNGRPNDAAETCSSYETLNDPAVCGDCTAYFECYKQRTQCTDAGIVNNDDDCGGSCD